MADYVAALEMQREMRGGMAEGHRRSLRRRTRLVDPTSICTDSCEDGGLDGGEENLVGETVEDGEAGAGGQGTGLEHIEKDAVILLSNSACWAASSPDAGSSPRAALLEKMADYVAALEMQVKAMLPLADLREGVHRGRVGPRHRECLEPPPELCNGRGVVTDEKRGERREEGNSTVADGMQRHRRKGRPT
uniref:BHLH domain-containing protein n=1 Tax=Oryza punctata TaxID=4537 RepID=A0A0E0K938_ORYPU